MQDAGLSGTEVLKPICANDCQMYMYLTQVPYLEMLIQIIPKMSNTEQIQK